MISAVYLNMPVSDVSRSREFFTNLGFSVNEQFSGPDNVCIVINPSISAMFMTADKFTSFSKRELVGKDSA
jgi:predicted lactoylglutathione lyase